MELQQYEIEHIAKMREIAPECMVLLKKNGDFPLEAPGKVALYGNGARRTIKGGTGSGDVNSRYYTTVEQGLKNAGFEVTSGSWMDRYEEAREETRHAFVQGILEKVKGTNTQPFLALMGTVIPEPV